MNLEVPGSNLGEGIFKIIAKCNAISNLINSQIDMWNPYQDALDEAPKTTNCTEGWHNALKALFLSAHPSMWTMFRGLRKDIAIQKLVIIQANAAHADSPKPKYKKLAERLRRKVEKYPDELDKLKYLRAISHIQ